MIEFSHDLIHQSTTTLFTYSLDLYIPFLSHLSSYYHSFIYSAFVRFHTCILMPFMTFIQSILSTSLIVQIIKRRKEIHPIIIQHMTCLSSHILTPALAFATTSVLVRLHKINFSLLTHIFHLFTSLLILWCMARKWRFIHSKVFISQPRCLISLKWPSSRSFHPALILFMFWNFFQLWCRVFLFFLVASLVEGSVSCLPGWSWLLVTMIWSLCPWVVC